MPIINIRTKNKSWKIQKLWYSVEIKRSIKETTIILGLKKTYCWIKVKVEIIFNRTIYSWLYD